MAWRVAASLLTLRDQLNAAYPSRSKVSDGFIGDTTHAASASDHNPNPAGVVCAFDITHSPGTGLDAHKLADNLLANRHPNLKYLISNGRIAGAWTYWRWLAYGGNDPHDTHIHVSVGSGPDGKSQPPYDDTTKWNIGEENVTINRDQLIWHYRMIAGSDPSEAEIKAYEGKDFYAVTEELKRYFANEGRGYYLYRKNAENGINERDRIINELRKTLADTSVKTKAEQQALIDKVAALTAQYTEAQRKTDELLAQKDDAEKAGNALTIWLGEQINKILRR